MKIRTGFVSNSSSSSFICNVYLKLYEVELILKNMLKKYNKEKNKSLIFEKVFGEINFVDEEDYNELKYWIDSYSEQEEELSKYEFFEEIYTNNKKVTHLKNKNNVLNKIIIRSAHDNSIPYDIMDEIEDKLKATRIHIS